MANLNLEAQPIYKLAGLVNLHSAFESYPDKNFLATRDDKKIHPYNYSQIFAFANSIYNQGKWFDGFNPLGQVHLPLYKRVHSGGFTDQLSELDIFKRLWGVFQLGLHRDFPVSNPHTRAEHSLMTTIQAVGSLNSMFLDNPNLVLEKLRRDLVTNTVVEASIPDEKLIDVATKLLTVTTMLHDTGTVAGGDTMKIWLKSQGIEGGEEKLLEYMLFNSENEWSTPGFLRRRTQLQEFMGDYGLDYHQLTYIISCIQGKSETLIGELISSPSGDVLESDRIAYTLHDWWAADLFNVDRPNLAHWRLPDLTDYKDQRDFQSMVATAAILLQSPDMGSMMSVARNDPDFPNPLTRFPWNTLDPSDKLKLSTQGRPVYEANQAAALAYLRSVGIITHYTGYKLLGVEKILQDSLTEWVGREGQIPDRLLPQSLVLMTDQQLFEYFAAIPVENVQKIVAARKGLSPSHYFEGRHGPDLDEKAWANFPIKVSWAPDTLVFDKNGSESTLKKFFKKEPWHPFAQAIEEMKFAFSYRRYLQIDLVT